LFLPWSKNTRKTPTLIRPKRETLGKTQAKRTRHLEREDTGHNQEHETHAQHLEPQGLAKKVLIYDRKLLLHVSACACRTSGTETTTPGTRNQMQPRPNNSADLSELIRIARLMAAESKTGRAVLEAYGLRAALEG
jgi:hypothetical protein